MSDQPQELAALANDFESLNACVQTSSRAEQIRAELCRRFPNEFEHGYRTGYLGENQPPCDAAGYMIGHHTWPLVRKNAWFAGGRPAMVDPPVDIANFRARAHAIAAEKKAKRPAINSGEPPQVTTRRASEITPEPVSWLWKHWIASGMLEIIGGVPETGKTTIAMAFAAIISSGGTWPDGTRAPAGNVLIWTSEDSPANTLVPRLIRMGADLDRVHFIEETIPPGGKSRPFNPATDMPALVEKARAIGNVALLIIDPIVATVPMTRNSHNNAEARNGMQPVVDFAKASNIAVLGIGHLSKGTAGKDPLERLNGSLAFGALPRLVMGAAKNSAIGDDEPERIFGQLSA
jgi:AAA domain